MIAKKLLLRALLTLLIGTQSVGGTIMNIDQMAETIATTQMSEAQLKGYLQGMGVNLDTVEPSYLEAVYAQSQNSVGYFLQNNPRITEAVETIIDSETGEITIEPITSETIGTVEYTQKGFVGATTNAVFIASLLADWGLSMYGNWQYENDNDFKSDYNDLVDNNINEIATTMAEYFRALYPNDAKKAYEAYRAYASGNSPRIAALDQYNLRVWLDDEDIEKAWNGHADQIDVSKYCNPDQISTKSIWRIWEDEAHEFWAGGISQFFNKKEVENIARKLYEEQGLSPRYDLTYYDYPYGDHDYQSATANSDTVFEAVREFNNYKGDVHILPIPLVYLNSLLSRIPFGVFNFIYTYIDGAQTNDIPSTTRVFVYTGNIPEGNQATFKSTKGPQAYPDYEKGYALSADSDGYSMYRMTITSNSVSYDTTTHITGSKDFLLGMNRASWRGEDPDQHTYYVSGGAGFIESIEEHEPTSLLDWAHSNIKFPSIDDVLNYIDNLPKFTLRSVNPNTGEQEEQDWVKVPFLKRIKDQIHDYYDENDLLEDVDFSEDDELPDYIEDAIIHREEKDDIQEYKKPYDKPAYDEDPYHTEAIKPSPSDIIIPPRGTTPNTAPTTPTSGGSPVIIPPVVPVGGSSSALFSVYNPTASEIDSLGSYLWGSSIVELLAKFLQNPIDAVISLHQIYITPSVSGRKTIKLGYLDSGVAADCVSDQYEELDCGTVFVPEYYNDARDYSPWTQVQIYLPFIGIVPLSAEDIIGSTVNVKYGIDVYTGSLLCSLTVTKPDGATQTLYTYEGNGAVQYPLTGANMNGIIRGTLGAMTGGMIGGISGAIVGGMTGALSGGATVSRSGGFGGNSGAMSYKKPYIIVTRKIPDDAFNYAHYYGLPANRTTTLVNCYGYTRVKSMHIDNIARATQAEKDKIESILKQGIMI